MVLNGLKLRTVLFLRLSSNNSSVDKNMTGIEMLYVLPYEYSDNCSTLSRFKLVNYQILYL